MTAPDRTISKHHTAILAMLRAGSPPFTVYDGQVPNPPSFPYALLNIGTGIDRGTKLCGDPDETTFRFLVTSVGLTADSVFIVADETKARVLGVRPSVDGRAVVRIRKENDGGPVQEDRDVTDTATGRHPMFGKDTYVFESRKG
ncbi:hypothetical protein [Amycolatopsis sp. NPDC001319]|uniref:hypothetical protein n=1 Tax=unclassified Amycolatopsis TaxID=2618356 RepID=UPI0036C5B892